MRVGGKILNPKASEKAIKGIEDRALQARKVALFEVASAVHSSAIKMINDNSDGVKQQRYNPNRIVNVSQPGSPPNSDTGRLVQSIKMEFIDGGESALIGTNLKYGAFLEFGTLNMAPRPWLSTAFKENTIKAAEIFKNIYKKEK